MNHPTSQPTTHTPTPWEVFENGEHIYIEVESNPDAGQWTIAEAKGISAQANAAHIVRCVNTYPALLAALKDLLGISVDIVAGEERDTCRHCGRDYTEDNMEEAEKGNDPLYLCPSDDCPGYIARHAIALAEGSPKP